MTFTYQACGSSFDPTGRDIKTMGGHKMFMKMVKAPSKAKLHLISRNKKTVCWENLVLISSQKKIISCKHGLYMADSFFNEHKLSPKYQKLRQIYHRAERLITSSQGSYNMSQNPSKFSKALQFEAIQF